jgi:hypothetical protein
MCARQALDISKHGALRRQRHTISNGVDDRVRETELRKRVPQRWWCRRRQPGEGARLTEASDDVGIAIYCFVTYEAI